MSVIAIVRQETVASGSEMWKDEIEKIFVCVKGKKKSTQLFKELIKNSLEVC